ncbi:HIT-like domain-containing protein [Pelagophyceae sp. CCMP2097]|nr:HIT-like domain-containing protein [Pelagophyceae sp. CCMP2097]
MLAGCARLLHRRVMFTALLSRMLSGDVSRGAAHAPPLSLADDVAANPTVFGKLLRGESPVRLLFEDDEYFAFRNIKPYARLAALVIPKRLAPQDPDGLTADDLQTVKDLKKIALQILKDKEPLALKEGDYWLRFHRRPFNSVNHLHMHVIAPASRVSLWTTLVFFNHTLHAVDVEILLKRLEKLDARRPTKPAP